REINKLPALKSLTLDFGHYLSADRIMPFDLPILERLEEFRFYSWDKTSELRACVQKYATVNPNLRRIELAGQIRDELDSWLKLKPDLLRKITWLNCFQGNNDDI